MNEPTMAVFEIPVENVHPNPRNPRKDLGDLDELEHSIRKNGIRQNLTVTPILDDAGEETDEYRLIAGHRRFAAAKQAKLKTVPCNILRDISEDQEVILMLEENMIRQSLTPMEEGQGVQMCLDLGISYETLEKRTGLSKQTLKHRMEIAKLDPEIYEEKDSTFQLTIHAMYALEKIKDINTRNQILKEATDNQNLIWRANSAAEHEKLEETKAAIIEYLEHKGIFRAPDDVRTWTNGWSNLGNIDYSQNLCGKAARHLIEDIIEKELKINIMEETVDYLIQSYGSQIHILWKKEEAEEEEEEEEEKESVYDRRNRIREQMKEIWDEFKKDVMRFCQDIIEGKYSCPKEKELEILEEIWKYLMANGAYIDMDELYDLYEDDSPTDKEKAEEFNEQIEEKIKAFSMTQGFIAFLGLELKNKAPFKFYGEYNEEQAEEIKNGIKILEEFGFSLSNAEQIQMLGGFHPLFEEAADAR